jgi:periplasmic copper chaperone A
MRRALIVAAAALLAAPAAAQAHVTVQPTSVPAGGEDTRLAVRVPNEMDNASTVKLEVQLPPGFAEASVEPNPGWTVKVTKTKLATPIHTDDGDITEAVSRITWTGDGKDGSIPPGGFKDFGLSVLVPGKAGDKLTFKALQTYSNGDVVRWIGPEDSDNPAPVVSVTAPAGEETAAATATPATATPAASNDSSGNGLAITALVIAVLGLLTAVVALLSTRRRART